MNHDAYAALKIPDFRWYLAGNLPNLVALNMQTVAISWEIFDRTKSYENLALVGLVQIIPVIGLFMPAGHLIDRVDRKKTLILALASSALWSAGLLLCSLTVAPLWCIYALLLLIGVARTFVQPARSAFLPQIVPREIFTSAVTWHTSTFQLSTVVGPALAGGLIGLTGSRHWPPGAPRGPALIYALTAAMALVNCCCLAMIRPRPYVRSTEPPSLAALAGGVAFVWKTKVILGAMTLDMFAVLLGGATALLPGYAKDILHVGPASFGLMRAAPGIGAVSMSFFMAHRPPIEHAGRTLLWAVAGFGLATIVFGLSEWFPLSLVMLFVLGALDMISVVIRHTLVQLLTPDSMRGRVSAVNGMFIGVSNELGEFESGMVAHLFSRSDDLRFGPLVSAVSGGVGTLVIVGLVGLFWPPLRKYGRLGGTPHPEEPVQA